eukprot:gene40282-49082_t
MSIAMKWACTLCTFSNHEDLLYCEVCENPRAAKEVAFLANSIIDLSSPVRAKQSSSSSSSLAAFPTSSNDNLSMIQQSEGSERPYSLLNMLRRFVLLCSHDRLYLSNPFPEHHTQRGGFGAKWSCGYRNIQTLCSALMTIPDYKPKLFARSPSIHEVQQSIENAWKAGFDPEGARQLDHKLCGTNKWIGATECAVFFRSRGFRARIVDFVAEAAGEVVASATSDTNRSAESSTSGSLKRAFDGGSGAAETSAKKTKTSSKTARPKPPVSPVLRRLTRWILSYFTARHADSKAFCSPLYLQYHGHSVSVVGVVQCGEDLDDCCLVTFDPYDSTQSILRTLYETLVHLEQVHANSQVGGEETDGMAHLSELCAPVVKPVRKFKAKQFQVVYIESGLMGEAEMRASQYIDA